MTKIKLEFDFYCRSREGCYNRNCIDYGKVCAYLMVQPKERPKS